MGFVPSPRTAFAGVTKLPAAHVLVAENGRLTQTPIGTCRGPTRPTATTPGAEPDPEIVAGFREQLERAVVEQRMSEVPLGALISGGLDSASIAALLQAHSPDRLHTFNIGFEQPGYDEARYAALAAAHIGTQHHQVLFRAADFDRYPDVLAHLEEPQCSATALPIYLLYEACRAAGLTVILTGEGADELLGGYHWFQGDAQARPLLGLAGAAAPADRRQPAAHVRGRPARAAGRPGGWAGALCAVAERGRRAGVLSPELGRQPGALAAWQPELSGAVNGLDPFRQFQYFETHTRLVDFINFEVDRMSMAHSIEARVPFLDHELWEYAARLPSAALTGGPAPKALLRAAMRAELPAEILARRKQGLAAPHSAWLRQARLPEWAESLLTAPALRANGYFDADAVQRLRAAHQAGRANHSRVLMGVLSTQLWHEQFIAG